MTNGAARGVRARVRDELTTEIRDVARRQLAEQGAAGLSLRAVAREVGMVSSAIYRYYPSRDELLTALIIDAYASIGGACRETEATVRRTDLAGRWLALARAARQWAVDHPQEYALIYGSPIPGYQAPQDTVDPATQIPLLLLQIVGDGHAAGRLAPIEDKLPRPVRADLKELRALLATELTEPLLARGLSAWSQLIGSISFELFGQLKGSVTDYPAFFDYQMTRIGQDLGLPQR